MISSSIFDPSVLGLMIIDKAICADLPPRRKEGHGLRAQYGCAHYMRLEDSARRYRGETRLVATPYHWYALLPVGRDA